MMEWSIEEGVNKKVACAPQQLQLTRWAGASAKNRVRHGRRRDMARKLSGAGILSRSAWTEPRSALRPAIATLGWFRPLLIPHSDHGSRALTSHPVTVPDAMDCTRWISHRIWR